MVELSYDLERDITTGTKRFEGFLAKIKALEWWIHTPRWTKINDPDWGHQLEKYQHEALTDGVLSDMEADLIIDIERDLSLKTAAIYLSESHDDALCDIAIVVSDGTETGLVVDQIKI